MEQSYLHTSCKLVLPIAVSEAAKALGMRTEQGLAEPSTPSALQWFPCPLSDSDDFCSEGAEALIADDDGCSSCRRRPFLEVSNPSVPLPRSSLQVLSNFVTREQASRLHAELSEERYEQGATSEGFDGPRRRVFSYHFNNESSGSDEIPSTLVKLQQRLKQLTGLEASDVRIEEYQPRIRKTDGSAISYDPKLMSTFAVSNREDPCPCQKRAHGFNLNELDGNNVSSSCSCFVAEIPLLLNETNSSSFQDLLQNWNLPEKRAALCWHLRSPQHWTDVRLHPNTAIIRRSELLKDWRSSRVVTTKSSCAAEDPCATIRVLRFFRLPIDAASISAVDPSLRFGYIPSPDDEMRRIQRLQTPIPPLSDLLTIIITTSPIKSNPSTVVLERSLETFEFGGSDFAYECPKVIVCDGFRPQHDGDEQRSKSNKVSRKHNNTKQAMRNGIVNQEQADNYRQFKQSLKNICSAARASNEPKKLFRSATVVELEERYGYGFALRHALRHCVRTPFVCVIQHDRTFMRPTPVYETVKAMWLHSNIKYVGFSMRSNLMYKDIFLAKYSLQQAQQQEWNDMVLRVPELRFPAKQYGPDSDSTRAMPLASTKMQKNIAALAESYKGSHQATTAGPVVLDDDKNDNDDAPLQHQVTLTPTLFWYDNVHICETEHYRDFIFHEKYKMVARGGFVEDKLSPVIKRTVERLGLRDGHSRFGCYLLDDHSGTFFTGHLDGGNYMTHEQRQQVIARHVKKQQSGEESL